MMAAATTMAEQRGVPVFRAGLGRLLPPGYLRVGPLASIPVVLQRFGVDAVSLLAAAGMPSDAFDHPDNAIPFPIVCRVLDLGTRATGREDFGLLISEEIAPAHLGAIGFLMKYAPDIGTALTDFTRYCHHHDGGAVPFLRRQDGLVSFGYSIIGPELPGMAGVYDGAVAIGCNIMQALCGPKWRPLEIQLSHRAPTMPMRYERHFQAPVRFDSEESAILFAEHWLDHPIPWADPGLRRMLDEQIRMVEGTEDRLVERVRRLLRVAILSRHGALSDVATGLGMSRRTLERRLEDEGSSFRTLSEEVRYEIACHLLASTGLSITEIALAVKFSEASAFSRAFRNWSGEAPRAWRKRSLSPPENGRAD